MGHGARRMNWRQVGRWAYRGGCAGAMLAVVVAVLGFLFSDQIGPDPRWKLLGLAAGLMVGLMVALPAAAVGAIVGGVCALLRPSDEVDPPPSPVDEADPRPPLGDRPPRYVRTE